ncbi:MAG: biotin--[acetyl-CoA-carboxylase] ligase [Oscillospiraceae bacterium]|jgi:BirA family biotin operon repressor/biotin-[acetyl-CoA-carboxylase] ligase|nr:biotin--[acetyl-CoA-carboxylase] ligase [Oscillospiraceae bacterium]
MSKAQILQELLAGPVSGGSLSKRLGISRTAVWKAVELLRADGFEIASLPSKGYQLVSVPDILLPELIAPGGWSVVVYDSVDSTNNVAKSLADGGARDMTAVLADVQTGGRGRSGKQFISEKGQGMYLTVILRPKSGAKDVSFVTSLAAVASRRAVEKVSGLDAKIKWTNDLVINRKKICGILTELSIEAESGSIQYMVIGIGINCAKLSADFPPELRKTVTSLEDEGKPVKRYELARAVLEELSAFFSDGEFTGDIAALLREYSENCITVGKDVMVLRGNKTKYGRAEGIDDRFALVVRYENGETETVSSGEVSVRGMYGYV